MTPEQIDAGLERALRSALAFAASRSAITAEQEKALLACLVREDVRPEHKPGCPVQYGTAEPVAWMYNGEREEPFASVKRWPAGVVEAQCWTETPLFTHPHQTEAVEVLVQLLAETRFRAAKEMREMIGGDEIADMPTLLWKARQDVEATLKGSRP